MVGMKDELSQVQMDVHPARLKTAFWEVNGDLKVSYLELETQPLATISQLAVGQNRHRA